MDKRVEADSAEDLLTIKEVAATLDIGESTAWLLVKRHRLPRYRIPARGKTTLVRRGDVLRAYHEPVPIGTGGITKKAAGRRDRPAA